MTHGFLKNLLLMFRPSSRKAGFAFSLCLTFLPLRALPPPENNDEIQDITGQYRFISADDTLALLEEEGKLHGYIDVYQNDEESDAVLSYVVVSGARKKDRVEFKTSKVHQKYYRFAGTVARGAGHEEKDPDYLRLVGDLEIVTPKPGSQEESVQRMHLIFKSLGKSEEEKQE